MRPIDTELLGRIAYHTCEYDWIHKLLGEAGRENLSHARLY